MQQDPLPEEVEAILIEEFNLNNLIKYEQLQFSFVEEEMI